MKLLNPKSNVTICAFHEGLTYVSLCDKDMCNGPKGAQTSFNVSSGTMPTSMMLFIGTGISYVASRS